MEESYDRRSDRRCPSVEPWSSCVLLAQDEDIREFERPKIQTVGKLEGPCSCARPNKTRRLFRPGLLDCSQWLLTSGGRTTPEISDGRREIGRSRDDQTACRKSRLTRTRPFCVEVLGSHESRIADKIGNSSRSFEYRSARSERARSSSSPKWRTRP